MQHDENTQQPLREKECCIVKFSKQKYTPHTENTKHHLLLFTQIRILY